MFTERDFELVKIPHVDQLVIKLKISDSMVSIVLVDGGSSSNIILWETFRRIRINESLIWPTHRPLPSFNNLEVKSVGTITLPIYTTERVVMITFMLVNTSSLMNVIMGRHWIHVVKGVMSTLQQVMHC